MRLSAKKVCVIGAGISGISVANDLTRAGIEVLLVEKNPYPGGQAVFYGCKATAECVRCGVCLVREAVATLKKQGPVECYFSSRPAGLRRSSGQGDGELEVEIESTANPIDWTNCVECGLCVKACPENAISRAPGWKYYVNDRCTACGKCVAACLTGAISLKRQLRRVFLAVDAVVLATGYEPFDPTINRKWGFGTNPAVVTGTQMERLFFEEKYLPREARSVAFLQCVGSRNLMEGEKHCSRVCCAYALRMAGKLKDEHPDLEIDFYHMDIQRFGKNFDQFWKDLQGKINTVSSNPISLKSDSQGHPVVRYESQADLVCREKAYDVVVLANGISPSPAAETLADLFDLDLNSAGFLVPAGNGSGRSAQTGIFTAGTCKRPMRIDDCLEDAAAVSRQVIHSLGVQV